MISVLIIFNLFCSIVIVVWNLYFYFKFGNDEREGWTKIFYSLIGIGWIIRNLLYFLDVYPFTQGDINPAILSLTTFTLASLAVGSVVRVQKETNEFREDIIKFIKRG